MPAPIVPVDGCDFLNSLPAYDNSIQVSELLDLIREIQTSGNYYWAGIGIPEGSIGDITVGAGKTVNGTIVLPPGSIVTGVSGTYDPNGTVATNLGFKFRLYDKGSKTDFVYGSYIKDTLTCSLGELQNNIASADEQMPFPVPGTAFCRGPFILTTPGQLNWEITNLDTVNAVIIQLMLDVSIPTSMRNFGAQQVSKVTN